MRKKASKKVKKEEVKEEVKVEVTDVGEVIPLTADEDNPASDGKEFAGGESDE